MNLFNQRGFSLVQGLVISAVLAGTALVTTKMITEQKLATRSATTRDAIESLHAMVYTTLQDGDNCMATVNGIASITNPVASAPDVNLTAIKTAPNDIPIIELQNTTSYTASKIYMNGSVSIPRIVWRFPADLGEPATLFIDYERYNQDSEIRTKQGYGGKNIRKSISIEMVRSSTGTLTNCYAVKSGQNETLIKDFCENLGESDGDPSTPDSLFVWDDATNTCQLRHNACGAGMYPGTVFAGISSTGRARCVPIKDWVNLNNLIDPTPLNCDPAFATAVRFEIVPGSPDRVRIRCN